MIDDSCLNGCCLCRNGGGCLASMNEDFFAWASASQIIGRLDRGEYPRDRQKMIDHLMRWYKIDYEAERAQEE